MMNTMLNENQNLEKQRNNNTVENLTVKISKLRAERERLDEKMKNIQLAANQLDNRISNLDRQIEILKKSQSK